MKLFIIDTETTDLDPSQGATIIELAWLMLSDDDQIWKPISCCTSYIQHSGYIHPRAQAQHHIRADQLTEESGALTREKAVNWLLKHIEQDSILVAHNVDFDSKFLPELTRPWVCTLRSAKHVWPDAPGYGNQVLRYWLNIKIPQNLLDIAPILAHMHPHQALYDVATTSGILLKILEMGYTPDQLIHATRSPLQLKKIEFGKHKGLDYDRIPRDYLLWLQKQPNLDPDVKHTVEALLNK
jgi:exodeoxyribonuclease X